MTKMKRKNYKMGKNKKGQNLEKTGKKLWEF